MKIGFFAFYIFMLSTLNALNAFSSEYSTKLTYEKTDTLISGWSVECVNNVKYLFFNKGYSSAMMTAYINPDTLKPENCKIKGNNILEKSDD